jgi:hypothetical protein
MMILPTCFTASLIMPFLFGTLGISNLTQNQKQDPPARFEGVVKSVDDANPNSIFLTIAVKEMRPTTREDEVVPVQKNYQFKVLPTAKIMGMDGKPVEGGIKSLKPGTKVRVETKGENEKSATLIEILPQTEAT